MSERLDFLQKRRRAVLFVALCRKSYNVTFSVPAGYPGKVPFIGISAVGSAFPAAMLRQTEVRELRCAITRKAVCERVGPTRGGRLCVVVGDR